MHRQRRSAQRTHVSLPVARSRDARGNRSRCPRAAAVCAFFAASTARRPSRVSGASCSRQERRREARAHRASA
ncbi:ferredoxin, partial [Burkholderia multivorans]